MDTDQIHTDELPGRTVMVNGEEHLFFSGTSYLGIPHNPEFRGFLVEGMERYGTNYSSSRNSNLRLKVFDEAEAYLANWTGAEAALTMSSGYMAGQIVVQALTGSGHFVYAPGAHPALWRSEVDTTDAKQDFDAWVNQLLQHVAGIPAQHIIIVCNSLDPLQARDHSFSWVASLPENKQYTLIIDDSHGFGITGESGAGCYRQVKQYALDLHLIVLGSLGKALGVPAGVILSDAQTIEQLKRSTYFGGASPAIPAYLYAFLQCQKAFSDAREKLLFNIDYFKERLEQPGLFRSFANYPVLNTSSHELCPFLLRHKIMISSFRYPTPADDPITRVVLNSLHTPEDLERLANHINQLKVVPNRV
ncbi:aminotransferase class I/II-fold pyridoxal phosphate-dependent enzyme [Pontibacter sp. MBLB2868]|uniref:aminotransferase class I/II-fold pyridoxal phosphate-dependent enzyme n=1 Tax=Pontibacter sp. MBLB2868 TaxID=3451555 RepID=UPI003F74EA7B